ncbi:hypothetical protein B0H16DRAFT_138707 [Mycena metata]|uniref:Uncharacterized protein n=1 Tax=Mycena metata TaxID=1033252 RepID=A0AAD7NS84_9AGAR|nr:hypothetical protein B0H16DRAFT_138707 [Mycena metata]
MGWFGCRGAICTPESPSRPALTMTINPSAPLWPSALKNLDELRVYLDNPTTPALWRAIHQIDFHTPEPGLKVADASAYTDDDRNIKSFVLFGQVRQAAKLQRDHLSLFISLKDDAPDDLQDKFAKQTEALWRPVRYDDLEDGDHNEYAQAERCEDCDRTTGARGINIEVHLAHMGSERTLVYVEGPAGLTCSVPTILFPIGVADWLLISATLHRRWNGTTADNRRYELLARHLRVLRFDDEDDDATLSEHSESETVAARGRVADGKVALGEPTGRFATLPGNRPKLAAPQVAARPSPLVARPEAPLPQGVGHSPGRYKVHRYRSFEDRHMLAWPSPSALKRKSSGDGSVSQRRKVD